MIQASELRIGNWVEYPLIGYAQIRTGADIDNVFEDAGNAIDLSPEILEKAGFAYGTITKKDDYMYISCGARIAICYNNGNGSECSLLQDNKLIDLAAGRCKYLHQLQNLYKCLSGEELKVNL